MTATIATTFMHAVVPCLCLISVSVMMASSEATEDDVEKRGDES